MIIGTKNIEKINDFIIIESDIEEIKLIELTSNNTNKSNISNLKKVDIESDLLKDIVFLSEFDLYEETDYSGYTFYTTTKEVDYYYSEYSKQRNFFKRGSKIIINRISSKTVDLTIIDPNNIRYQYFGSDRYINVDESYGIFESKNADIDIIQYIFNRCIIVIDDRTPEYISEYKDCMKFFLSNSNTQVKSKIIKEINNFIKKNNKPFLKIKHINNGKPISLKAAQLFKLHIKLKNI